MKKSLLLIPLGMILGLLACEREFEDPQMESVLSYQPLMIGMFWVYEVEEVVYFGENDSEESSFFYRDRIRTVYVNDALEQVFVVERSKSQDQEGWSKEYEYTLQDRGGNIVRNIFNQPLLVLISPPKSGIIWDGNLYRNESRDDFEMILEAGNILRVNQENGDDKLTFRDIRYEVYQKEVGLSEFYSEVLTYCARNECLGEEIIDSGTKTHMKLINHGLE